MQPIFRKLKDYEFTSRLNDLIVRINNDARQHINKDIEEIKACAEGMVELVLLQDKINGCVLRPMDIHMALKEASWSFNLIKKPQLITAWTNEIKTLSDIHLKILYENTKEVSHANK